MAADFRLELVDSGGGITSFDYDGDVGIAWNRTYKDSANPPQLTSIIETWEVKGARITASSASAVWDDLQTFLALCETRTGTRFTSARIVRDPDVAHTVERTLGPSTHQEFRIEAVEVPAEDVVPDLQPAKWRTQVPLNLTISAVRVFADTDSIVGLEQTVNNTYVDGLHRQEITTKLTTAEGTNVVTLAEATPSLVVCDISALGNSYTWETNGPYGFTYTLLDTDEKNSRVPTSAEFVSIVQQMGTTIGTPSAGNSVNRPFRNETETFDDGKTHRVTRRAEAHGPGHLAWVNARALIPFSTRLVLTDPTNRFSTGEWVRETTLAADGSSTAENATTTMISVRIEGGGVARELVPITGGFPPRWVTGPEQPWTMRYEVEIDYSGATDPSARSMMFPPLPGDPWVMIPSLSAEDWPKLVEVKKNLKVWKRTASIILKSHKFDLTKVNAPFEGGARRESYFGEDVARASTGWPRGFYLWSQA